MKNAVHNGCYAKNCNEPFPVNDEDGSFAWCMRLRDHKDDWHRSQFTRGTTTVQIEWRTDDPAVKSTHTLRA